MYILARNFLGECRPPRRILIIKETFPMSSGITLKPYEYVIVIEVLGGAAFVHSIPILGRRVKEDCNPNETRRRGSVSHI